MELITIYNENEIEVQIFGFAADYLEYLANSYKRLLPMQAEEILSIILNEISQTSSLKDKKIITTSQISILSRKKIFNLVEEYKELEDALLLLSEAFDLTTGKVSEDWKINVKNYIKSHYFLTFQKNCDIIFFSERVHEVSLAIVLFKEDKILILPLTLNEDDFYQKLV